MVQYDEIKSNYSDSILLFRMGDFYETFGQDATIASEILGIVLTKRSNGKASDVNLAGFPYHSLDNYLPKLIKAGHKVAICEQIETVDEAKKRGIRICNENSRCYISKSGFIRDLFNRCKSLF